MCFRFFIFGAMIATQATAQSTEFRIYPDRTTARVGEIVTWSVVAEVVDLDGFTSDILNTLSVPRELSADFRFSVVNDIGFDVSFDSQDVLITRGEFESTFDSVSFNWPATNGTIVGDSIEGAVGANTELPHGHQHIDYSNPLLIYTFDTVVLADDGFVVSPEFQFTASTSGAVYDDQFFHGWYPAHYTDWRGNDEDISYVVRTGELEIVNPSPGTASALAIAGLIGARRRR